MERTVQPELLDSLAPDHPDAVRNRRDLRLTNAVMGNPRWFSRTLPALLRSSERVLDLGAGTGELAHRLNRAGLATDDWIFGRPRRAGRPDAPGIAPTCSTSTASPPTRPSSAI